MPNANTLTAATLVFTAPNSTNYNPSSGGWNATQASNYRQVKYYLVSLNGATQALHRTENLYNATGGTSPARPMRWWHNRPRTGSLSLSTQYLSFNTVQITTSAKEGLFNYSLTTSVTAPGN